MKRLQIAWMSWKHISWIQVTGSDFTILHHENLGLGVERLPNGQRAGSTIPTWTESFFHSVLGQDTRLASSVRDTDV